MRLDELNYRPLVVVDVQPAYKSYCDHIVQPLMKYINRYRGPILMLVNAEESGVSDDHKDDIIYYWIENGLNEKKLDYLNITDKGFGFLRAWMDLTTEENIIKIGQFMISRNLTDNREIEERGISTLEELLGDEYEESLEGDPLILNWLDWNLIRSQYNGSQLCGGGRYECLREVELMFKILRVKYTILEKFVYQ